MNPFSATHFGAQDIESLGALSSQAGAGLWSTARCLVGAGCTHNFRWPVCGLAGILKTVSAVESRPGLHTGPFSFSGLCHEPRIPAISELEHIF